ncbi:O-antigen polymerase [Aeromonas veronii]|uniref:O-antigen polymerase n=1 Tax=Aeromonas veronii TaxID=654 RepID=UPI0029D7811D|nr:O-antigen polymerase [Aeromonas veronii]MDX7878434.1 O-antigen polymerase [Aeromonas veronii]
MSLFYVLCLILILGIYYTLAIKRITPISIFLMLTVLYASGPIFFESLDYSFYNQVIYRYRVFDDSIYLDVMVIISLICALLFLFDIMFMRQLKGLKSIIGDLKNIDYPCKRSMCYFYFLMSLTCFFISIYGVYVFGLEKFLYGYRDSTLNMAEEMNHSSGWSLYTNGAMLFYMFSISFYLSIGRADRVIKNLHIFLIMLFVVFNLLAGARLITLVGLIGIFLSFNCLIVKINWRFLFGGTLFLLVFLSIGVFRGGGNGAGLLYSFLEFPFVGFGLYNIYEKKSLFDTHIIDMLVDAFIFMSPAYLVDKSGINRTGIIRNYFPDNSYISPIGGNFYVTDIYLYCGVFGLFVFILMFLLPLLLSFFISKMKVVNNYFIISYCSLIWISTYGFFWLLRNQLIVGASMVSKIMFISIFLFIVAKALDRLSGSRK